MITHVAQASGDSISGDHALVNLAADDRPGLWREPDRFRSAGMESAAATCASPVDRTGGPGREVAQGSEQRRRAGPVIIRIA